ncbi:DUF6934 family protein [Paraflavitalea pollutisoli]|uniref:DUF6934 family protein n=1 Tax=Paraflavitalea pollutisoli TaxID=3034143 RepID=UPI0023ED2104|nr:hypothetical protein [Paraflavitalea sp. H1-2-19X]
MQLETYPFIASQDYLRFEFLSQGPQGTIKKVVLFQQFQGNLYNLAFGDWDETRQRLDDLSRTNNNDRDKVIATVASTVALFIDHYKGAMVIATGSTPSRTRLYQSGINKYWPEISRLLVIEGLLNEKWELHKKNVNYQAFLVKKK